MFHNLCRDQHEISTNDVRFLLLHLFLSFEGAFDRGKNLVLFFAHVKNDANCAEDDNNHNVSLVERSFLEKTRRFVFCSRWTLACLQNLGISMSIDTRLVPVRHSNGLHSYW